MYTFSYTYCHVSQYLFNLSLYSILCIAKHCNVSIIQINILYNSLYLAEIKNLQALAQLVFQQLPILDTGGSDSELKVGLDLFMCYEHLNWEMWNWWEISWGF